MVLLTSGQVQVALSSAIVCTFTILLFLVGYTTQQRSVDSLHVVLRPRAPEPRHKPSLHETSSSSNARTRFNRPFGRIKDRLQWQNQLLAADSPFDWSQLAFAQLVRDHTELCDALIVLGDLHRLKSAAPRILLFPQHWVEGKDEDVQDSFVETSKRLLKKASRRYRVTLVPIKPDIEGKSKDDPEAYSNSALAAISQYKRIMSFPLPGLVLASAPLDSILAFTQTQGIAAYPSPNISGDSTILITSSSTNQHLLRNDMSSLTAEDLLPDPQDHTLFSTTHELRTLSPDTFNADAFLAATAYMRFTDPDLPGPEFDVPYSTIVQMRPSGADQSFLWEKMYSTYKDRMYGVCGLDLKAWPPQSQLETADGQQNSNIDRADL